MLFLSCFTTCHHYTCQTFAHLVVIRRCLWDMWKHVKQWYLVDISIAWMYWSRILLPSVIIFWWLVCLSGARYRPNILPQSPVCTRCSINPMNWPFDWWGTAQECWEIGKVRGRRVSEWKRWEGDLGFRLWGVILDTCLSVSPAILKKPGSNLRFLENIFKSLTRVSLCFCPERARLSGSVHVDIAGHGLVNDLLRFGRREVTSVL